MSDFTRRRFMLTLLSGSAVLAMHSANALPLARPVVVLTSYPDTVIAKFQDEFERLFPEYRLQILWRMPFDALPYLEKPGQSGVDVYWSASPRNFATLARQGALRKLDINHSDLPMNIGHTLLSDPDYRYVATEMAGYGYAINPHALEQLGVSIPKDWTDLLDARLEKQIALPDPAQVGFAPVMVDIVLQAYGWDKGWAIWSEITGNSVLLGRGSSFVTDEVGTGHCAIGLTIDFFAASAIANGAPLKFVYPQHTGINPAQVAITTAAPNPDGARQFVEFLVSDAAQTILSDPDIRKLPVRPDAYSHLPAEYFNPFKAAENGMLNYDESIGLPRLGLITALFGAMLSHEQPALASLWHRMHELEKSGKSTDEIRKLLSTPPVTEQQAGDKTLLSSFAKNTEGAHSTSEFVLSWRNLCDMRRHEADNLLSALEG